MLASPCATGPRCWPICSAGLRRRLSGARLLLPLSPADSGRGRSARFIEAGASDFFVPRGYVHLIVNARGTGGSGGSWTLLDQQEREDLHDLVEWVAAQPWCDGNVGMLGVSYFAMAQLAAAATKPPHLKAIAPLLTTDDLYGAVWHHGLLNAGFISAWLPAVGALSQKPDSFWRSWRIDLVRDLLRIPAIHARMQNLNGEAIVTVLKDVIHARYPEHPFGEIWRAAAVEHPTHDAFWDARDTTPLLGSVEIPVYLGADWDNVPLQPPLDPSRPGLRCATIAMCGWAMLPPGGFSWPWESLHYEVLAWYDHWLKGRETGVMDGPPIRYQVPGVEGWRTAEDWPPRNRDSRPSPCVPTAGLRQTKASPAFGNISIFRPIPASRPTPIRPDCRPCWLGRRAVRRGPGVRGQYRTHSGRQNHGFRYVLDRRPYDAPPVGEPHAITAGWLRAAFSAVDEGRSVLGAPVPDCRTPRAAPVGQRATYRIPVVPNALRLPAGHRLRLVIASADETDKALTVLGFTHVVVREASRNTIYSASRLWLPLLPPTVTARQG